MGRTVELFLPKGLEEVTFFVTSIGSFLVPSKLNYGSPIASTVGIDPCIVDHSHNFSRCN